MIRNANPVANSSGKNIPPLTSSGKKPVFGELDENQDYFPYDDYSNEVNEPETPTLGTTGPPQSEPSTAETPTTRPPTASGNNATDTPTDSNNTAGLRADHINLLTFLISIVVTRNVHYIILSNNANYITSPM